jgi:hypothetical protein
MLKKTVCWIVLAVFLAQVTGCYTIRQVSVRDTEAIRTAGKVTVKTREGRSYTLTDVRIEYPKLVGTEETNSEHYGPLRVSLDVGDVDSVTVRNMSAGLTIAACAGGCVLICAALVGIIALTKESCPLVYARIGAETELEGELYSGAVFRGLERRDLLKLYRLKTSGGRCALDLSNEADETQYTDELTLLAVDHPRGTEVLPDCSGGIRTVSNPVPPKSAIDGKGADALDLIRHADGRVWIADPFGRDAERDGDLQDGLTLRFPVPAGAERAKLAVRIGGSWLADYYLKDMMASFGSLQEVWNRSMDENPKTAERALGFMKREGLALNVSVMRNGRWEETGFFYPTGPVTFQDEMMVLSLDGVGDDLAVRLSGGVLFWMIDRAAVDFTDDAAIRGHELPPASAKASDGTDAAELLASADDRYFAMPNTGDRVRVEFAVPPESPGLERSYIVRSEGYYTIHPPAKGIPNLAKLLEFRRDPHGFSRNTLKQFWKRCGYRPES